MKNFVRKFFAAFLVVVLVCTSHGVMIFADGTKSIKDEENVSVIVEESEIIDETEVKKDDSDDTESSELEIDKSVEDESTDAVENEIDESSIALEEETSETTSSSEREIDETTNETEESMLVETSDNVEIDVASISDAEEIEVDENYESESNEATVSDATETKKDFLIDIYADYDGVFSINDDNTIITLEKDATLTNPINIKNDLTLDLNGHTLIGPENNYALIVDNATFTFKDKKHKGMLKGNAEYAVIKSNNSTLNFISGIIKANDGFEAVNFEDSNVLIIGSEIYGGNGVDGNKGSAAIVANYTKDEYDFKAVRGLVFGGEGGFTGEEDVKGSGGKAIVLNGNAYERVIDNLPLSMGEIGDAGSADGGPAVLITGAITDKHIILPNPNVLIGGSGGKNNITKNKKLTKNKNKRKLFGTNTEDMTIDEITKLSSYTTPDKYITSLKNQRNTAWCSTFAHLAMAETYMLKNYWDYCQEHLYNGEFDLSEVATAYFSKEHPTDPLGNAGPSREENDCMYTLIGADEKTFVNYAAKFNGIQSEADAVFPDDINNMHTGDGSKSEKALAIQNNGIAKLTNYRYAPYTDIYDYSRPNMISNIKNSVAKNGSAAIGLTWHTEGNKTIDDTHATFAYAQPFEIMFGWQGGHALQIIGWDDNYSKDNFATTDKFKAYKAAEDETIKKYMDNMRNYLALWGIDLSYDELYNETKELLNKMELEGDGAFLCKNSHGNFVWVSYYTSLSNCFVFDAEFVPAGYYDDVYYYDGGSSPNEIEVFDAYVDYVAKKDNEIIKAISIVASREMDKVKVTLEKVLDENAEKYDINGIEMRGPSVEKYVDLKVGNNFIELSEDQSMLMKFNKGEKFTVVINAPFTTVGMLLPIDKNYYSDDCNQINYKTTVSGNSYVNRGWGRTSYDYFDRTDSKFSQLDGDLRVHVLAIDETNYRKVTLHCGHEFNTFDSKDVIRYRKEGTSARFEPHFTLSGNEFLCWEDQNGNRYGADEDILISGDMDLTVIWKSKTYKLDLVDDGASYIDGYEKPTFWTYGQITVFPTAKEMYKKGYKFDGWREVWNDPDSKIFTQIGDKSWVKGDQEFFAKWVKIEEPETEAESETTKETETETTKETETETTKATETETTKETEKETETIVAEEETYYKVEFRPGDGGSGSMIKQEIKKGTTEKLKPNEFTKAGHKFKHWIDLDGKVIQNEAEYTPVEDNILYAIWEAIPTTNPVPAPTPAPVVRRSSGGGGGGGGGGGRGSSSAGGPTSIGLNSAGSGTSNLGPGLNRASAAGGGGLGTDMEVLPTTPQVGEVLLGNALNTLELQNQQNIVVSAVSSNETKLNTNMSNVPVNTHTENSTWKTSSDGKWHLDVINEKGQVEQAKNTWACLSEMKVVNGQNMEVQNFYFFDNNGDMLTGWLSDAEGKTYYLGTDNYNLGQMSRGWTKVSNDWYFFNSDGIMMSNTVTPDGSKVGADGKWVK